MNDTEHEPGTVVLDEDLTACDCEAFRDTLLALLHDGGSAAIDASQVRRAGTPALQVLASFARSARLSGRQVRWLSSSEAFRESVRLLGLADELGIGLEVR